LRGLEPLQRPERLIDNDTGTVIDKETGEILGKHHIDPTKNYWRNQLRSPGRWPRLPE